MTIGLVGKKIGMTRIFTDVGDSIPVTVVDVSHNRVSDIKSTDGSGYSAVQLAFGKKKSKNLTRALSGIYEKAKIEPAMLLKEFRVSEDEVKNISVGDSLMAESFSVGQFVDVSGNTKGKGFSGVIRRHNFASNRASHGNSLGHNKPGSTGNAQDPGRVFPGKKMAGQYGSLKRTMQNLEIIRVDNDRQLIMLKGSIAGPDGDIVFVKPSKKRTG